MGWWVQDSKGHSLLEPDGDLFWGDGPADIIDAALDAIDEEFVRRHGRKATFEELRAGFMFSARVHNDLPEGD